MPRRARAADEVLRLAAALQQRSEHPLARAVLDAVRTRRTCRCPRAAGRAQALPGRGVRGARWTASVVLLGSRRLMRELRR